MNICDCHAHIGEFFDQINGKHVSYSSAGLARCMGDASVDVAIVSNISAIGDPVGANLELAAWAEAYPQLVPLAWVTPGVTDVSEVRRLFGMGFRGMKLHPTAGGYQADSAGVDSYLRICGERGSRLCSTVLLTSIQLLSFTEVLPSGIPMCKSYLPT